MSALLHRSRLIMLAVAATLGVSLTLATATPASATDSVTPSERARQYYGAIAFSPVDGGGGLANDYRTKKAAKRKAKKECKNHSNYPGRCFVAVWVRNGCAAVSVKRRSDGSIARYGWAVRKYKGPAVRAAQHKCGKKCRKYAWVCTTRRF